jgi:hypothetical protein
MFWPGNKALVSLHNAELVDALLELRDRFGDKITLQERAILTVSVHLLDYIWNYAKASTNEEFWAMSREQQNAVHYERTESQGPGFTVDEFHDEVICAGGLELIEGRIVPKL